MYISIMKSKKNANDKTRCPNDKIMRDLLNNCVFTLVYIVLS